MKKNVRIKSKNHSIDLITNGAEDFDRIVLCFHGFGGDKWGGSYAGLKKGLRLRPLFVCRNNLVLA